MRTNDIFISGRRITGQWVFGGIERKSANPTRKCFMVPMGDRTKDTLMAAIEAHILPESTIYSGKDLGIG